MHAHVLVGNVRLVLKLDSNLDVNKTHGDNPLRIIRDRLILFKAYFILYIGYRLTNLFDE